MPAHENKKVKMIRKTIQMPPSLVTKIEVIAIARKKSFASIIREAAYTYESEALSKTEEAMITFALDTINKSNLDTIEKLDELEKKLDETHQILSDVQ